MFLYPSEWIGGSGASAPPLTSSLSVVVLSWMMLYSWCFITMGGSFCSNFSRGKREPRYKSPASVSLGRADSSECVCAYVAASSNHFLLVEVLTTRIETDKFFCKKVASPPWDHTPSHPLPHSPIPLLSSLPLPNPPFSIPCSSLSLPFPIYQIFRDRQVIELLSGATSPINILNPSRKHF